MSNKKHIDRVFQEKLKDFEVSPSPKVWKNIKDELEQSDDNKKVFPIWLRLAGVAALLLLLFTIGNGIISNSIDSNTNNKVVETENTLDNSESDTENINTNNSIGDSQNTSQDERITDVNSSELNSDTNTNNINNSSGVAATNPSESDANLVEY